MKVRYYKDTDPSVWAILESDIMTPKWTVIDCYNKGYIGFEYKDMNEFIIIHQNFIQDLTWYNPLPIPKSNRFLDLLNKLDNLKPDKITPHKPNCNHVFKLYVGMVETFEYCTKCDKKKVS